MRTCKFCNCDISNKKSNATICGSAKCKSLYDKERKKKQHEHRFCEICGCDITHLPSQRRICLKEECIQEQKRRKYKTALKLKKCKKCGKEFQGTVKQKCCEECRKIRENTTEMFEQTIVCKYCDKKIKTVLKHKTNKFKEILKTGVCDECKEKSLKVMSEHMKTHNPMFNKETKEKVWNTHQNKYKSVYKLRQSLIKVADDKEILSLLKNSYKDDDILIANEFLKIKKAQKSKETKDETIERIKTHNPMFNKETKEKVQKTLQKRLANGETVFPKGEKHGNWRGNRNFNRSVRIELRKWVKNEMEKVDFTCQKCGKRGCELHVHHIKPLREIIDEILEKNTKTIKYLESIKGSEEYFAIIKDIVKFHYENNDIGIVVCPDCHNEIDEFYNRKTYNGNKKNNKETI